MFMTFSILPLIGLIFTSVITNGGSELSLIGYIIAIGGPIIGLITIGLFLDQIHKIISKFSMIIYPLLMIVLSIGFFYLVPIYSYTIIILGVLSNVLAVVFNRGKMPVYSKSLTDTQKNKIKDSAMHKIGKKSNLFLLIDRISLPNGQVASIGDFLITTGVWIGFISNLVVVL